jgi:hypothetical protein
MFVCSPACHIAREAFAEYVDFVEGCGMSSPLGVYALGAGYGKSMADRSFVPSGTK